jgi:hypothetical protein
MVKDTNPPAASGHYITNAIALRTAGATVAQSLNVTAKKDCLTPMAPAVLDLIVDEAVKTGSSRRTLALVSPELAWSAVRTANAKIGSALHRQKRAGDAVLAQTVFEELKEAASYLGPKAEKRLLEAGPKPLYSIVSQWLREQRGVVAHERHALAMSVVKSYASMQTLNLFGKALETLPECIGQLNRLQLLDLRWNVIAKLPNSFNRLTELTKLNMGSCDLREVPSAVFSLFRLQELDVWNNLITEIPDKIGTLQALTSLNVSQNLLTQFPESMCNLLALEKIEFSNNRFTTLPTAISSLRNLRVIGLNGNLIAAVIQEVGDSCDHKTLACLVNDGASFLQAGFSIAQLKKVTQRKNGAAGLAAFRDLHANLLAMHFTHGEIVKVLDRADGAAQLTCLEKHSHTMLDAGFSTAQLLSILRHASGIERLTQLGMHQARLQEYGYTPQQLTEKAISPRLSIVTLRKWFTDSGLHGHF